MDFNYIYKYPNEKSIIDRYLFNYLTDYPVDLSYKFGFTPNMLTTVSFSLQLLSIKFLLNDDLLLYSLFYILGYYFDCIDGPLARKYNMVTVFGDFYDHITDVLCFLMTLFIYIVKLNIFNHTLISFSYIIIFYGLLKYVGCQEIMHNKLIPDNQKSMTLYFTTKFVRDLEKEKRIFKVFGFTFFILFHTSVPFLINLQIHINHLVQQYHNMQY